MEWYEILGIVCRILIVVIPIAYAIICTVVAACKDKDWSKLMKLVTAWIAEAELKFNCGADKKEWVLGLTKTTATSLGVNCKEEDLSNMIDDLVLLSKQININK